MITEEDKILIDKYAYNNLSEDELKLFGKKIKNTEFAEYARQYTEAMLSIQTVLEGKEKKLNSADTKNTISMPKIFAYAATILIIIGIGSIFTLNITNKNKEIAKLKSEKDTLFNRLAEYKEITPEIKKDTVKIIEKNNIDNDIVIPDNKVKPKYSKFVKNADLQLIAMRGSDDIADDFINKKKYGEAIKFWEAKLEAKDADYCETPIEIGRIALLALQEDINNKTILKKAEKHLKYSANLKNCYESHREASLLLLSYCELIKENKSNALLYLDSVLNESTEQNKVYFQAKKLNEKLK